MISERRLPWVGTQLLVLSLVLTAAILLAIPSLLLAVKVVSDGPIYHLYFAARWWKAGRLILVAAPFGENAATYFPANGDLWFTWLMVSWGGESLAKIGQAPFLLLAGASAYGCARSLGISRSASLIATCWFVSSIPLFLFSFEPNVNTIFVAGYLLSAYFFLRFARGEGDASALVLGALAAGEAIGTKAVGVVFVPPLIVLMLATIEFQSVPRRSKLIRTLAVVLAPAVTGGYWFGRNLVLTGNPLYPLEVRWMGQTLLAGWYGPDAMRTSPYYLPIGDWRALGDILLAVLDPRLAPIWLASVAGAWAVKNPKVRESGRWIAVFSILAVLNIALYWFVIPYRTQQRFMLQALGLAVVPLAATLDRGRWLRYAGTLLLAAHVLTPESWPFPARGRHPLGPLTGHPERHGGIGAPLSREGAGAAGQERLGPHDSTDDGGGDPPGRNHGLGVEPGRGNDPPAMAPAEMGPGDDGDRRIPPPRLLPCGYRGLRTPHPLL